VIPFTASFPHGICFIIVANEACECLRAWYGPPPAKKLQTFDEEATGQREIDQGYMALTALMARIVVSLLVTGKMGFLMIWKYVVSNEKLDY
jgi:hypothetical protein